MEDFEVLSKNECKSINGGNILHDFWYGVGYVAGTVANAIEDAVEYLEEHPPGNFDI